MPVKRQCCYEACPVEAALDLIGGRWKAMIVGLLLNTQPLRFNELKRRLNGISHRVLSAQLNDLERCGMLNRVVYAEVPPRVEYSLTPVGLTLQPLIVKMRRWGEEYALAARGAVHP